MGVGVEVEGEGEGEEGVSVRAGAGLGPWARLEGVVLGVVIGVSESVEEDFGEWMLRDAVLGIIVRGEAEPSGVERSFPLDWLVV